MVREETGVALSDLLDQLTVSDMREIAAQHGWNLPGKARSDYVSVLATKLARPEELARSISALSAELREALRGALVAEDGGGITATGLAHVVTALRGSERPTVKPVEAAAMLSDLARWGLVLPWREVGDGFARYVFPRQLQLDLPPLAGWCPRIAPCTRGNPSMLDKSTVVDEIRACWEFIARRPLGLAQPIASTIDPWAQSVSANGERPVVSRRRSRNGPETAEIGIQPELVDQEGADQIASCLGRGVEHAQFVCHLLRHMDLLRRDHQRLSAYEPSWKRFARHSYTAQYEAAAQAYLSLTEWSELDMILRQDPSLRLERATGVAFTYADFRSQLVNLRLMLIRLLASAEDGWCSTERLMDTLRLLWPEFTASSLSRSPRWQPRHWCITTHRSAPENSRSSTDWHRQQGAFMLALLNGPLYWLGLAHLWVENSRPTAVELHGLGDLLNNRSFREFSGHLRPLDLSFDPSSLLITVNCSPLLASQHALLGKMARIEHVDHGQTTYRLDALAFLASLERGDRVEQMSSLWSRAMAQPMPHEVRTTLESWSDRYGQVRIASGLAVLEVADGIILQELQVTTSLSQHIIAWLSPRSVALSDQAVDLLIKEMAALGHTPKQERRR